MYEGNRKGRMTQSLRGLHFLVQPNVEVPTRHQGQAMALVATVSASGWPWALRQELPTTNAKYAVIVATTAAISRPLG